MQSTRQFQEMGDSGLDGGLREIEQAGVIGQKFFSGQAIVKAGIFRKVSNQTACGRGGNRLAQDLNGSFTRKDQ